MSDTFEQSIVDLLASGNLTRAKAEQFGVPGQRIAVKRPGSQTTEFAVCDTVVNSRDVVLINGRVRCETAPQVTRTEQKDFLRVSPMNKTPNKPNIKYLLRIVEAGQYVFYVGGWQAKTEKVFSVAVSGTTLGQAALENLGGDDWSFNLRYTATGVPDRIIRIVKTNGVKTNKMYTVPSTYDTSFGAYFGHGFWMTGITTSGDFEVPYSLAFTTQCWFNGRVFQGTGTWSNDESGELVSNTFVVLPSLPVKRITSTFSEQPFADPYTLNSAVSGTMKINKAGTVALGKKEIRTVSVPSDPEAPFTDTTTAKGLWITKAATIEMTSPAAALELGTPSGEYTAANRCIAINPANLTATEIDVFDNGFTTISGYPDGYPTASDVQLTVTHYSQQGRSQKTEKVKVYKSDKGAAALLQNSSFHP